MLLPAMVGNGPEGGSGGRGNERGKTSIHMSES